MRIRCIILATSLLLNLKAEHFDIWITAPDAYKYYPVQQVKYCSGRADPMASRIMEDSYGFIWFGTLNSLISYDGTGYINYQVRSKGNTGLTGFWVLSLFEDRDRNIWAGTIGGLNRFNRNTERFDHFYPDTTDYSGPNNVIRFISQDKSGQLWLITNRNIFRFSPDSGRFTEFKLDSLAWLLHCADLNWAGTKIRNAFLEDDQGKIWIGTPNGLFFYDPVTDRHSMIRHTAGSPNTLGHDYITAILQDTRKNLWIATKGGGLNRLTDKKKFTFEQFRHDPHDSTTVGSDTVLSLSLLPSGQFWIGCSGSMSLWVPEKHKFTTWVIQQFPDFARWKGKIDVTGVFEDHQGGLWLYSRNLAIGRLLMNHKILLFEDIPSNTQQEVCMDRSGSFWVGTVDNFAFRIDLQAPRIMHYRYDFFRPWVFEDSRGTVWAPGRKLKLNMIGGVWYLNEFRLPGNLNFSAMVEDSDRMLWFAGKDIYKYNPENGSMSTYTLSGPLHEKISRYPPQFIHRDRNGNLWFGCRQFLGFLNTANGENVLVDPAVFGFGRGQNWQIEQVMADTRNVVWIATLEGLCAIDNTMNTYHRHTYVPGKQHVLSDNAVYRIAEDRMGRVWVLTLGSGLHMFDRKTGTFSHLDIFRDLPNIGFNDMVMDHYKNLWIFHTDGMSRYSTDEGTLRNYGLQARNLNATINSLGNGNIYIVPEAADGTYIFHPDSIKSNSFIPPVYITRMLVNSNPVLNLLELQQDPDHPVIKLRNRENSLAFTFSALNYTESEKNRYRYRMIGQDADTLFAGTSHSVEYRKMRPGRYTFWVTGSNNDGLWNKEGTQISFVIKRPWYSTAVAWNAYALLLVLSVYIYIRFRIHQLSAEKATLERMVADRTNQISEQKGKLEQMNRKILEMDQVKTRFFANISHEFRTPLTLIQGPVEEMIGTGKRPARERNVLKMIYRNTLRLMSLVNQLLDIARIDSSNMKLVLNEADVIDFLRTIAASFSSLAETRKIGFTCSLPIVGRLTWFDGDKIEKIVNNLLSNAFKYTPEGGRIELKAGYLLDAGGRPVKLEFSVADTGRGIPYALIEKIFDRFFQVEEGLKGDGSGTGLGLALTKDLVLLMHGEIRVESEPGHGSIFRVGIPLGKDHLDPSEFIIDDKPVLIDQTPLVVISGKGVYDTDVRFSQFADENAPTILIVEDNKDIRMHIRTHFSRKFRIMEATDGLEALPMALQSTPDLVITDLMMPHMDGITLCQKLKTDERTSHLPVIMLTAKAGTEDKIEGLETGADDYVSKPFSMKELYARAFNLIEQRRKLRERFSREISVEPGEVVITPVDERFLQRAILVVEKHLKEETFSVSRFCEEMHMSRSTLFRKLYAITGQSALDFMTTIRLKRAGSLMLQKYGNVMEIALEVGFSNPSYFAKQFKKQFGISPHDFMKGISST